MSARFAAIVALSLLASGCEPTALPLIAPNDAGASPNASILPAPLATEAAPELLDAGATTSPKQPTGEPSGRPDAGLPPPPEALRNEPLAADSVAGREAVGVSLDAMFRWRDVPAPPKAPEVSAEGLREVQRVTALTMKIDLSEAGRMRLGVTSHALFLPARTELRARVDRYGHALVWPNAALYRVIRLGALRTLFGERRVDVTPLVVAAPQAQAEGRRLGLPTRRLTLTSSLGTLTLELARVLEAGEGGPLLCRALVELVGVDPKVPTCLWGEVPLSASYAWQEGGGVGFEVTGLAKQADLGAQSLLVPPPGAGFTPSGLPSVPNDIFLTREELRGLRSAAIQRVPSSDPAAPGEGFVAVNHTDMLAYVLLDGIPVVAVPAASERYVIGPLRGRYVVQWRSFLGESIAPPQTVDLPARIHHGALPDAGPSDGNPAP